MEDNKKNIRILLCLNFTADTVSGVEQKIVNCKIPFFLGQETV